MEWVTEDSPLTFNCQLEEHHEKMRFFFIFIFDEVLIYSMSIHLEAEPSYDAITIVTRHRTGNQETDMKVDFLPYSYITIIIPNKTS